GWGRGGGRGPVAGRSSVAGVDRRGAGRPPSVTRIRPAVPATVARVIERALAKAPADRFASAHQFAEALAAAGQGSGRPEPVARGGYRTVLRPTTAAGAVPAGVGGGGDRTGHAAAAGGRRARGRADLLPD